MVGVLEMTDDTSKTLTDGYGAGPPCEYCDKIIYFNEDDKVKDKWEPHGTFDLKNFHHVRCLQNQNNTR